MTNLDSSKQLFFYHLEGRVGKGKVEMEREVKGEVEMGVRV